MNHLPPGLALIDLDQPLPGQSEFVSCWVHHGPGPRYLVDPGPTGSAPELVRRLQRLGLTKLDFILLTHIHLDHAGGTAEVLRAFPAARVICHPKGAEHLAAPERLWEGSLAVLGHAAEAYGRPSPVPRASLAPAAEAEAAGIRVLPTPGHAPHHLCFVHDGTLFAGEAAGTCLALPDGTIYLRPATPPRFVLEPALASLDLLLGLEPEPRRIAYGHHGLIEGRTRELLGLARDQLLRWTEAARRELADRARQGGEAGGKSGAGAEAGAGAEPDVRDWIHTRLLVEDPYYAHFRRLPPVLQARELGFTRQTLDGILGYLREREEATGRP